ncbi:hypothetical protein HZA87_05735 [Candidatus Uhrbacteria bacterium]|nr:hypothetical protein [Candidatus Uhrbacteria bacterium]
MPPRGSIPLGELITLFYKEFLAMYGDEELASVATAAAISDLLSEEDLHDRDERSGRVPLVL